MDRAIRIGKYLARRALGAGSFATVWLAYDELLDAEVAVKVLAENWSQHPDVRRRFIDEAKLLRRIDHERIVRVHDVDELPDGRPYIVMTWADRGTLHDRVREHTTAATAMPIDTAVRLAIEVCECLAVVHDFGAVHRDVKPSNVLFRTVRSHERAAAQRRGNELADEQMVLGDFGLAKDLAAASGFTQAAGTPAYMAPEQARPTAIIDRRVDIFGASSVLYEMLTGRPPIAASTLSGVRRDTDGSGVQPIRAVRPEIPPALAAVIGRGLAFDPDQRYASAPDLAAALQEVLADLAAAPSARAPISVPPAPAGPAGRVHDLLTLARRRAIAGDDVLTPIEQSLGAPVRVLAIGTDASDAAMPKGAVVASAPPGDDAVPADVVVVALPDDADDVAAVVAAAKATIASFTVPPVAVVAMAADPALANDVSVRALTVDVVSDDDAGWAHVRLLAATLCDRASLVRASSALTALAAVCASAGPEHRQTVHDITDAIDALRLELPMLGEIDVLRDDSAGRSTLPVPLRRELRRLLLWMVPTQRLGLAEDDDVDLRGATQTMLERWRTLSNTGRIPFSGRGAAEVVERSLERLYVELGG